MLHSYYVPLCKVILPYKDRQHYMHSFDLAKPVMREGFEDYLEPVLALCRAADATKGIAHMTVDEKIVKAGMSQRRPKPHVDGCFIPGKPHRFLKDAIGDWGGGGGGGWNHYCNDIGRGPIARMAVIVAASAPGCRAWKGFFDGEPSLDGDLTHITNQLGEGEVLPANVGYLLSPDCVHESMLFSVDTKRTFLRIALPVR
jgi:hypothetical protein